MIKGFTTDKLDLVSTFDRTIPFVVGQNGVTNIIYTDSTNTKIKEIHYTIDEIDYVTTFSNDIKSKPTTFTTNTTGFYFDSYNSIKEEFKMGLVFSPKINNELFIERQSTAVFERHSRLSEILTLDNLIEYRNGYYGVRDSL